MQIKAKRNRKIFLLFISITLILVGIMFFFFDNFKSKIDAKENDKLVENFIITQKEYIKPEEKNVTTKTTSIEKRKENYLAVLEIPSIKLKRGFYNKESKNNNVNKNIYLLKESQMPNEENGNLILAAHSGSSRVAFFDDLKKLKIEDEAIIYYLNHQYTYKLVNIYEIEKNGKANIVRDFNKNTLTLITCKQKTKKQFVFIFELKGIEGE